MEYKLIAGTYGPESNGTTIQDYCTHSSNFNPRTADVATKVIERFKDQFYYKCLIWLGIFRNGSVWEDRFGNLVPPGLWKPGHPKRTNQRAYIHLNNKDDPNIQWASTQTYIPYYNDYFICQRGKLLYIEDNVLL